MHTEVPCLTAEALSKPPAEPSGKESMGLATTSSYSGVWSLPGWQWVVEFPYKGARGQECLDFKPDICHQPEVTRAEQQAMGTNQST